MISETDLKVETETFYQLRAKRVMNSLNKRGIQAQYLVNRREALERVLQMIPEGATVGRGDSVTLEEVGVIPALLARGKNEVFNPFCWDSGGHLLVTGSERFELQRKALMSDFFLTGTNAITLDGKLVNIDAVGNRVAAMIFGPKKVIVVAGANKIVKDVDEAIGRIKNWAAPMNTQRHHLKHHVDLKQLPCFHGLCADCTQPGKLCSFTVIIEGERAPTAVTDYLPRIHVLLVGEKLGI